MRYDFTVSSRLFPQGDKTKRQILDQFLDNLCR